TRTPAITTQTVFSDEIVSFSVGPWAKAAVGTTSIAPTASPTAQSTFRLISVPFHARRGSARRSRLSSDSTLGTSRRDFIGRLSKIRVAGIALGRTGPAQDGLRGGSG